MPKENPVQQGQVSPCCSSVDEMRMQESTVNISILDKTSVAVFSALLVNLP